MTSTSSTGRETFDYVVVGAGASGAALAARLSEDPAVTVLLLEAGGPDKKQEVHIPAAFSKLFKSPLDWDYSTEPQEHLGDRSIYWPRGKMLGGSTSINAMMWVRGYAADYDGWAEVAGPLWSYQALLPYFRRAERVMDNTDPDQGSGGAVHIEHQRSPRSHTATFLAAAAQAGYAVESPNSAQPEGFSQTMVSQKRGKRCSTADAYLKPIKGRANLTVLTDAQAARVLFEGTRAVGVEYLIGGVAKQVFVAHEVVLSGGAVNTPQLLMLSGVGPAADLTALGIDVVVDAPAVGANLQDHLVAFLIVESEADTLFAAEKPAQIVNFLARARGMLTSNVGEAYGFVRTQPDLDLPDIEIIFAPVPFVHEGLTPPTGHGVTVGAILLQPESTGRISIVSADPLAKPRIEPAYLTDPEGNDRTAILAGLGICADLLETPALSSVTGTHYFVPEGGDDLGREERAELALANHAHTLYHPTSTARMGSDEASVVDPELRVRGVQGLRVADASIMPKIIRGHTQAPCIVIGERAADLLKASRQALA
jgi:choline dehydrogenase-like flavoprotein